MNSKIIKVLLIEDSRTQTILIKAVLAKSGAGERSQQRFHVVSAERLWAGLELLNSDTFDVILLDLSLPDADGLETLIQVRETEPNVPVVVLTGMNDEELAMQAMQAGAQDYLVKENFEGPLLARALRYAIERHRMQAMLQSLSLTDELTGLYNLRGFYALAEQELKTARRRGTERDLLLFYLDMDNLKQVNDVFGHQEGSRALACIAGLMKKTFRGSDILGRVGGDEFTALAIEAARASADLLVERLRENLRHHNATAEAPYELSFSVGVAQLEDNSVSTIQELMADADAAMYAEKRRRRKALSLERNNKLAELPASPNEIASSGRAV